MNITIRPIAPEDKTQWLDLWQGYLTFYRTELSAEITETTWQRLLNDDEAPWGFVAIAEDGTCLGIVHYLFHRSSWSEGGYCYLEDLFVSEKARGLGLGRSLIEEVATAAKAYGATRLYWATEHSNKTARKLYDQVAELTPFVQYHRIL